MNTLACKCTICARDLPKDKSEWGVEFEVKERGMCVACLNYFRSFDFYKKSQKLKEDSSSKISERNSSR